VEILFAQAEIQFDDCIFEPNEKSMVDATWSALSK
jgi:hypothetical protein